MISRRTLLSVLSCIPFLQKKGYSGSLANLPPVSRGRLQQADWSMARGPLIVHLQNNGSTIQYVTIHAKEYMHVVWKGKLISIILPQCTYQFQWNDNQWQLSNVCWPDNVYDREMMVWVNGLIKIS